MKSDGTNNHQDFTDIRKAVREREKMKRHLKETRPLKYDRIAKFWKKLLITTLNLGLLTNCKNENETDLVPWSLNTSEINQQFVYNNQYPLGLDAISVI